MKSRIVLVPEPQVGPNGLTRAARPARGSPWAWWPEPPHVSGRAQTIGRFRTGEDGIRLVLEVL